MVSPVWRNDDSVRFCGPRARVRYSDFGGIYTHDPATGGTSTAATSLPADQYAGLFWRALDRTVSFHADDAIHYRELAGKQGGEGRDDRTAECSAQCSTFLGQPKTPPGTRPKRFFIASVAPAQWCVFIFGNDTSKSQSRTVCGR